MLASPDNQTLTRQRQRLRPTLRQIIDEAAHTPFLRSSPFLKPPSVQTAAIDARCQPEPRRCYPSGQPSCIKHTTVFLLSMSNPTGAS